MIFAWKKEQHSTHSMDIACAHVCEHFCLRPWGVARIFPMARSCWRKLELNSIVCSASTWSFALWPRTIMISRYSHMFCCSKSQRSFLQNTCRAIIDNQYWWLSHMYLNFVSVKHSSVIPPTLGRAHVCDLLLRNRADAKWAAVSLQRMPYESHSSRMHTWSDVTDLWQRMIVCTKSAAQHRDEANVTDLLSSLWALIKLCQNVLVTPPMRIYVIFSCL